MIFHLTSDVFIHYWYVIQCKLYGFMPNKAAGCLMALVVLRARSISNDYIKLNPDGQYIAFMTSINHYLNFYPVLSLRKDYIQCNCIHEERRNIWKHVIKVFKS